MVQIRIDYQGGLRCSATHDPSGRTLVTDAPVDNHGQGQSFSPTDLVATALGTCMLTIMGIVAERHGWDLEGTTAQVEKIMTVDPVRRIGSLEVVIRVPTLLPVAARVALERAALACPVHASLHPDCQKPLRFEWA
ncbi:MAG: putative redox protein [Planctomycetota bacterium]|jgi:putative redox protein